MNRRYNVVRIDMAALAHNLGEVRRLVGPRVKIMAVVKADAYGHGMVPVGRHMIDNGADALGVMDLHEAVGLRDAGVEKPVYILAGFEPEHAAEIVDRDLTPFVYDPALAKALNEAARKKDKKIAVHLKLDTGMSRLGVHYDNADRFFSSLKDLDYVQVTGLATHFSDADVEDSDFSLTQIQRFKSLIESAEGMGLGPFSLINAANSATVLTREDAYFDLVRPGLMLYGGYPAEYLRSKADLRPAMSMTSRVIQVKKLPPGSGVSYGRTWKTDRETVIALVPTGYAHGFDRLLSNTGRALIRGRRAPLRGRVCMNLTVFDVTDIPGAAAGDEVVLLGKQGNEIISGETLADLAGTINYEIFCGLGSVNYREYI